MLNCILHLHLCKKAQSVRIRFCASEKNLIPGGPYGIDVRRPHHLIQATRFSFPGFSGLLHEQAVWLRCLFGRGSGSDLGRRGSSRRPSSLREQGDALVPSWVPVHAAQQVSAALPLPQISGITMIVLTRHQIASPHVFTPDSNILRSGTLRPGPFQFPLHLVGWWKLLVIFNFSDCDHTWACLCKLAESLSRTSLPNPVLRGDSSLH